MRTKGGIGYGTYRLLEKFQEESKDGETNDFVTVMSLSAYVTVVMLIIPTIFKWIGYLAQKLNNRQDKILAQNFATR